MGDHRVTVKRLGTWRSLRRYYLRLSPVDPGWLPLRHWRRLWLAAAVRLLSFPLLGVVLIPYLLGKGLVAGLDWLGGRLGHLYVWAANTDRERSGWQPPAPPRAPAPQLSQEWVRVVPRTGPQR
jgi:hypothetical protein